MAAVPRTAPRPRVRTGDWEGGAGPMSSSSGSESSSPIDLPAPEGCPRGAGHSSCAWMTRGQSSSSSLLDLPRCDLEWRDDRLSSPPLLRVSDRGGCGLPAAASVTSVGGVVARLWLGRCAFCVIDALPFCPRRGRGGVCFVGDPDQDWSRARSLSPPFWGGSAPLCRFRP